MPFAHIINALFLFIKDDLGFIHVTRAVAGGVEWLLDVTGNLLYGKSRWPDIGPIPWTSIALTAGFVGYALGGWRLAILGFGTFVWAALLGQWQWTMETLSVIVVAVPVAVVLGMLMGIASWRSPTLSEYSTLCLISPSPCRTSPI